FGPTSPPKGEVMKVARPCLCFTSPFGGEVAAQRRVRGPLPPAVPLSLRPPGGGAQAGPGDAEAAEGAVIAFVERGREQQVAVIGNRQPAIAADLGLQLPGAPAAIAE